MVQVHGEGGRDRPVTGKGGQVDNLTSEAGWASGYGRGENEPVASVFIRDRLHGSHQVM